MATTLNVIHELVTGVRDTSDAVVASGTATFYQPGTLTLATVYSDDAGSSAIASSVVTLNASGQYRYVYADVPVRMIVKKSDGVTTVIDTLVNIVRAKQTYITNTGVNGGVETTLDAWLSSLGSLSGGLYQESSGATARGVTTWLQKDSVQAQDFAAVGDDSADDTAFLQAALDHCCATGKPLHLPAATYKITAPLTITTGQCVIYGDGPKLTIIKNYGTTTNGLTINYGGATDAPLVLRDLAITCSTTSSGAAIANTNGNNARFINVETRLHRTGFSLAGATGNKLLACTVLSSDANAAGVGILLGASSVAAHCDVTVATGTACYSTSSDYATIIDCAASATTSGIGFSSTGSYTRIVNSRSVVATTTGVSLATGSGALVQGTVIVGNVTTGVSCSQANATIIGVKVIGTSTNGISASGAVTAITDCVVVGNAGTNGIVASGVDTNIKGCRIVGTSTTGINCSAARAAVSACDVTGNCTSGIVASAANSSVTGSYVQGTSTTGVTLSSTSSAVTGSFVTGNATTGISLSAAGTKAVGCSVPATCTTGISLTGTGSAALGCTVTASTTGITLGAASTKAMNNYVDGATTGVSVGAFANCIVTGNYGATNTSDCTVNASATGLVMHSNEFSALTDNALLAGTWHQQQRIMPKTLYTLLGATATYTPVMTAGLTRHIISSLGGGTLTVAAPATTGLATYDEMEIIISDTSAGSNLTWNGIYSNPNAGTPLPATLTAQRTRYFKFIRDYFNSGATTWWLAAMSAEY